VALSSEYVAQHVELAKQAGKPLVVEEFGYPRNGDVYDLDASTSMRDDLYGAIHAAVLASVREGGPLAGSNFWAWNGEGRAQHPDFRFRSGDTAFVGDPPHEPQGWYGVFDQDVSTRRIIRAQAEALAAL
jgi:mannan endo-1,4-beta-mannosidase